MLLESVFKKLETCTLSSEATDLLLAALDGGAALDAQLDADSMQRYVPAEAGVSALPPLGAYLRSLTVAGFRGIGPATTLAIAPGPGLTLVLGRNGSGKSSFAEALEVLLTGSLVRWTQSASAVFRDSWRSKHVTGGSEIRADFLIEGKGAATVARTWAAHADIGGSDAWLQVAGDKRESIDALGWAADLRTYRPFLSHSELEAFFGKPSELHDLLASVLGMDELTVAAGRLNDARKQRDKALSEAKEKLAALLDRLSALDDERARACLTALRGRNWDIAAARAVVAKGEAPDGGQLATLRRLAQLTAPPPEEVTMSAAALRAAADGLGKVAGTSAERARGLTSLLESALRHHEAHGDGDCPVCGRAGALTPRWREEAQQHLDRLREEAQVAQQTFAAARNAATRALALMQPPPPVLSEAGAAGTIAGIDVARARDAWRAWANRSPGTPAADQATVAGLLALATHIETAWAELRDAVAEISAGATAELSRRDDQWAPLAADIAAWCAEAEPATEAGKAVKPLTDARKWLVNATTDLRNARLAPLADQARQIWSRLRQESNVDLGAFRLAGSATRRALELDVEIDGVPGAALGVMSQGEINALALSIFLPRATMASSPFRFLVIDDPVQAMDPAKVDGLAAVLREVAATRQVIVFTHDNRLADAVRQLSIPATILEVTRRPQSAVDVRSCLDPVQQALKDASALTADDRVPAEVARRVVPGLCRTAVEAAFIQAFWRRQLRAGQTRAAIEDTLAASRRQFTPIAALGMFGAADQGGQVLPLLNRWGRKYADTFQALNRAVHTLRPGDARDLISDSRQLIAKIEEELP
jgi:recombinational DNA repair ATPase RecF